MTISNCGHDERNQYRDGKAGDQTGGEYAVINWYNRPWDVVLRAPDRKTGEMLATIARQAANNNKIGYDQNQRKTYYEQLKKADWHPDGIEKKCEADCSSSTAANVIATGHYLDNKKLQKVSPDLWTGNMKSALKTAGFKVLTDEKYLTGPDYLLPGDILLNEKYHVAINLTEGKKAERDARPYPTGNLKMGDCNDEVGKLQKCLNIIRDKDPELKKLIKKPLVIDKSFGPLTAAAVIAFKNKYVYKPSTSGVGPRTRARIKELI